MQGPLTLSFYFSFYFSYCGRHYKTNSSIYYLTTIVMCIQSKNRALGKIQSVIN